MKLLERFSVVLLSEFLTIICGRIPVGFFFETARRIPSVWSGLGVVIKTCDCLVEVLGSNPTPI